MLHKNYLTIVKALGILLMVIGHSGCPDKFHTFIYYFHMPLFFFCSGYFFKKITTRRELQRFCIKRVKGLYFPYLEWSLFFLIMHNVFFALNIYNANYGYNGNMFVKYTYIDILKRAVYIIFTMEKHEPLLGGFWFLKTLFLSSIFISVLSYIQSKCSSISDMHIWSFIGISTIISKYIDASLPIVGDLSIIFLGSFYFLMGSFFKKYEGVFNFYRKDVNLIFLLMLVFAATYGRKLSMFCDFEYLYIYLPLSMFGILFIFFLAREMEKYRILHFFYYIGEHTIIILALHFLCFKLVSFIYLIFKRYDIELLSSFPVLDNVESSLWVAYSVVGVMLPLLIYRSYCIVRDSLVDKPNEI